MGLLGALYGLRATDGEVPIEASISQIEATGRKLYTVILRDITGAQALRRSVKSEQLEILDLAPVLDTRADWTNSFLEHRLGTNVWLEGGRSLEKTTESPSED